MSVSFEESRAFIDSLKARRVMTLKRFEMSAETLRKIEASVPLVPTQEKANTLWGIPFTINNELPDGEVKPIYA